MANHVKRSSSMWMNESRLVPGKFSWQEGFGAFTAGKSQLPGLIKYIENQEEHHHRVSFTREYIKFLKDNEIEYDDRYIFTEIS